MRIGEDLKRSTPGWISKRGGQGETPRESPRPAEPPRAGPAHTKQTIAVTAGPRFTPEEQAPKAGPK